MRLFLERAHHALSAWPTRDGVVLADRPATNEEKFLAACLTTLHEGTDFALPDRIAINVLATSSHLVRLLQLADLIASCTVAYVSGSRWAEPTFAQILPLFRTELDRKGGVGLKLHPDIVFVNLYHWLLGDEHFVRYPTGWQLPRPENSYTQSPDAP